LFQWHTCKLAKLGACKAKCMTTLNKIYFFTLLYVEIVKVTTRSPLHPTPRLQIFLLLSVKDDVKENEREEQWPHSLFFSFRTFFRVKPSALTDGHYFQSLGFQFSSSLDGRI